MMRGSKKKVPLGDAQSSGFHNPFAQLLQGEDAGTSSHAADAAHAAEAPMPAPVPQAAAWRLDGHDKVVVRRERKGRGGKTVTLIQGLRGLDEAAVALLLTRLRKALGCGASAEASKEGPVLVIQGDQSERAAAFLEKLGVRRVVRGS